MPSRLRHGGARLGVRARASLGGLLDALLLRVSTRVLDLSALVQAGDMEARERLEAVAALLDSAGPAPG